HRVWLVIVRNLGCYAELQAHKLGALLTAQAAGGYPIRRITFNFADKVTLVTTINQSSALAVHHFNGRLHQLVGGAVFFNQTDYHIQIIVSYAKQAATITQAA